VSAAVESLNIQASTAELTDADLKEREAKFEALEARALELWKVDQDSAVELGKALIGVRDALKDNHGAFTMWYRGHDLDENRVHYCIRKVEGKIAAPPKKRASETIETPEPDFVLNKHNLAVAKFAPPHDGKFTVSGVHVDSNGTTATDGFMLVQVSLPPGQPETRVRSAGNFSRELALRASRQIEGACGVALGGEEATVIFNQETAIQAAPSEQEFPNYKKVLFPKAQLIAEVFLADNTIGGVIELLELARAFNPTGRIKFSFREKMVGLESETNPEGQKLLGAVMQCYPFESESTDPPAPTLRRHKALPPAPESEGS
jgi:hypothetical protein